MGNVGRWWSGVGTGVGGLLRERVNEFHMCSGETRALDREPRRFI